MAYSNTIREESIKQKVAQDYFSKYDTTNILGNIDFCVSTSLNGEIISFLWAEAKRGSAQDIYESFIQLVLTIGNAKTYEKYATPYFIGAFDAEKIAFLPYHIVNEIFHSMISTGM